MVLRLRLPLFILSLKNFWNDFVLTVYLFRGNLIMFKFRRSGEDKQTKLIVS